MSLVCIENNSIHVTNQNRVNIILQTIIDPIIRKILFCTKNKAKTIKQITQETGFSSSMTYRKIKYLIENDLLLISGDVHAKARKSLMYQSKIRKIMIDFDTSEMNMKIYLNSED